MTTRPIHEIIVGERIRPDMGDLIGLADSMKKMLLHPIVIKPDGTLIAGERRLRAAELLGWSDIPVTVVHLDEIARGEYAENTYRKDFTPSEAVAIKRALEPIEHEAAIMRMRAGRPSENFPKGRALDKVAKVIGKDRKTIERAEAVVDAAQADPQKFGKVLADMDRTGRVNGIYRRLKIAQQAERIRSEPPPLPSNGPYRCAVIDPPWPYEIRDEDPSHRGVRPYPTMSVKQICALSVASFMHVDSTLRLWIPNFHLVQGAHVPLLRAWDFEPKALLTWEKDRMGNGDWLRSASEQAILAVRGKPTVTLSNQTTVFHAPVRGHSAKPREFYDFVESLCPASRYADLFSRYRHNDKWDCHGDEAPRARVGDGSAE
jgi:N6-adenosine-specific RNA methylase IME4